MSTAAVKPSAWRYWVARWPLGARLRWGEFAAWYEEQGVAWPESERLAYERVDNMLRAKETAEGRKLPLELWTERPVLYFEPEPGSRSTVFDADGENPRPMGRGDRVFREIDPRGDGAVFMADWKRLMDAAWEERQKELAKRAAQSAAAKARNRLGGVTCTPTAYLGERAEATVKRSRRRHKHDPSTQILSLESSDEHQ